jgi:malonyl-CoA/methylmalonyl-CoA synthetase
MDRPQGVSSTLANQRETLFGVLQNNFQARACERAVVTRDGSVLTFGELNRRSAQFANVLKSLGLAPGDRVAAQTNKCVNAVVLYVACLRTGAIYVPINPGYKERETLYVVADATPAIFVGSADKRVELAAWFEAAQRRGELEESPILISLQDEPSSIAEVAELAIDNDEPALKRPDDPAILLYTSGTTGKPKGAILSERALVSNAQTLIKIWNVRSDDRIIHCLPFFHAHGLFVVANVALLAGSSMHWLERFDVDVVLDELSRATIFMGVPTLYKRLLASHQLGRQPMSVRLFLSGSAALSPQLHAEFKEQTGREIVERYGMSETGINASNPLAGAKRPGSVGFPLPDIQIRIKGAAGKALVEGEVEIRGRNLFTGYWRKQNETEAAMTADGWFSTGDVGRFDEDGYLWLLSRKKDVIITGGYNVYPAEVEGILLEHKDVVEAAVFGAPHPEYGECVVAAVVLMLGASFDEAKMLQWVADSAVGYKVPKRLVEIPAIPRNTLGKVLTAELRGQFADVFRV